MEKKKRGVKRDGLIGELNGRRRVCALDGITSLAFCFMQTFSLVVCLGRVRERGLYNRPLLLRLLILYSRLTFLNCYSRVVLPPPPLSGYFPDFRTVIQPSNFCATVIARSLSPTSRRAVDIAAAFKLILDRAANRASPSSLPHHRFCRSRFIHPLPPSFALHSRKYSPETFGIYSAGG